MTFKEYLNEEKKETVEGKKLEQIARIIDGMISTNDNAGVAKDFFNVVEIEWNKAKKKIK